jgi:acyl-CoA synthetase (AMP-forming)/AMP-acid ligase II
MLNVLPMFHIAIFGPINNMFLGGTNVFLHGFDFEPFLSCIEKERVNVLALTPVIISFLLSYPELEKYDLSSLESIGYAAAPMPLPLLKKAIETFGCRFSQAFGMTEMSPVMTILTPDQHVTEGPDYKLKRLESVGRPIVNVEVKVVDEAGKECPVGTTGEIIGRGDTMMKGYYKMPEATAEAIRDGWYHTGDMGYFDEYGYLYIVDRKKDMIISGGENIYPKEVEDCIQQMPGIADVAVIGVPDEKWIETVKALIILEPGVELTEEAVIRHCRANLASYKKPTSVEFMAGFPRNSMGKVQKHRLREPFWKGHERKLW